MVKNLFLNADTNNGAMTWIFVGLLVVLVIVLLVVPMFTNKKRAKQTTELHNSLKPGDVIKTVGGVIGTIKDIRKISPADTEMVIETGDGDNKTTMTFDIQALYQILTRSNTASAPEAATPDVFDEPVAKVEDKPVVAEEKVEEPAKAEEKAEEKPAEPTQEEQAATVDQPAEEKVEAPAAETAPKAKTTAAHKPVQSKKSGTGATAKKSTKK